MVCLNLAYALFSLYYLSLEYILLVERDKMFEAFIILVNMNWFDSFVQLSKSFLTCLTVTMATIVKFVRFLFLGHNSRLWPFLPWCLYSVHDLDGWKRLHRFI